jgi:hypothetical protein
MCAPLFILQRAMSMNIRIERKPSAGKAIHLETGSLAVIFTETHVGALYISFPLIVRV